MSMFKYEKIMKNILVLFALALFLISCDEDPVKPVDEVPFVPTGFTFSLNDSVHIYCNNGQLDHLRGDTIKMNWYAGEKSFKIDFLNTDGVTLDNPDPLVYTTYANILEHSTKEDKRAFASAYNFTLSITPHDEGIAHLVFKLNKEGETLINVDSIPVVIFR
jgi:hypothetical protein